MLIWNIRFFVRRCCSGDGFGRFFGWGRLTFQGPPACVRVRFMLATIFISISLCRSRRSKAGVPPLWSRPTAQISSFGDDPPWDIGQRMTRGDVVEKVSVELFARSSRVALPLAYPIKAWAGHKSARRKDGSDGSQHPILAIGGAASS
jgi:hypothetical protein